MHERFCWVREFSFLQRIYCMQKSIIFIGFVCQFNVYKSCNFAHYKSSIFSWKVKIETNKSSHQFIRIKELCHLACIFFFNIFLSIIYLLFFLFLFVWVQQAVSPLCFVLFMQLVFPYLYFCISTSPFFFCII